MNVIIDIHGRDAIPVRALPLLARWGTMHPQKIAGALAKEAAFDNLHELNSFHFDDGAVHSIPSHHWSDHTCRNLKALSDTIKHSEINHETGHSEWQVKALAVLPRDAFVWKDDYMAIYDSTYGTGSRTRLLGDAHHPTELSGGKPPIELNFNPPVDDDMRPIVQAALDAIRGAVSAAHKTTDDVNAKAEEQHSGEYGTSLKIAPDEACGDARPWLLIDSSDPIASQQWYTPARYFARQLAIEKPTLLANRELLADKVSTALFNVGIKKRGNKKRFDGGTVKKAFANVNLG